MTVIVHCDCIFRLLFIHYIDINVSEKNYFEGVVVTHQNAPTGAGVRTARTRVVAKRAIMSSVVQIALHCMARDGRDLIVTRMSTNARTLLNTAATIPTAPTSTDLSFAIVILGTSECLAGTNVVTVSAVNMHSIILLVVIIYCFAVMLFCVYSPHMVPVI